jgi:very-short-patch-repair endonuclease
MRGPDLTLRRAKGLRREMSAPEIRLWMRIGRRLEGSPNWRRQHPMGPFILDFYCARAKLCVEVDGWGHNMGDQPERDDRRDGWLKAQGVTVLRVAAADIMRNADEVADLVRRTAMHCVCGE